MKGNTVAENMLLAMREFFSTPDHPVTNKELMDFKKEDPEGFVDLKNMFTELMTSEGG